MMDESQPHKFKLTKIYKIEGNDISKIKQQTQQIQQKLTNWMRWSSIENSQVLENFLLFPNQSIYNQGLRITHLPQKQCYSLELIKNKWKNGINQCFCYEYQQCMSYDDPIPMLKVFGYNHHKRKSKNVTIFKNLKFGLEIILYHFNEKDQNLQEVKRGKLEVIETGTYAFNLQNLMIKQIEQLLEGLIVKPVENQLHHQLMTLKNMVEGVFLQCYRWSSC